MAKRRSVGANWSSTVQGSRRRGYVETPRGSDATIRRVQELWLLVNASTERNGRAVVRAERGRGSTRDKWTSGTDGRARARRVTSSGWSCCNFRGKDNSFGPGVPSSRYAKGQCVLETLGHKENGGGSVRYRAALTGILNGLDGTWPITAAVLYDTVTKVGCRVIKLVLAQCELSLYYISFCYKT